MRFLIVFFVFTTLLAKAQFSPLPSPGASISQIIGITKISIEYSRPGVKSRNIFGGLIPYNKIWRTGANASTKIEFSNDVYLNGTFVKSGKYALLTIPTQFDWILVLSTDLNVTEQTYNKDFDVLRTSIPSFPMDFTENLTFEFSDVKEDKAFLNIFWEKIKVKIPITVNNEATLMLAIDQKNNETAGAFQQVAEYMLNKNMSLEKATEYIDKSISLKETFRNNWVKARILEKNGKNTEALSFLMKAQALGTQDEVYSFFKEGIEQNIEVLKGKLGKK